MSAAIELAIASYDARFLRVAGGYFVQRNVFGGVHAYGRGKVLLDALARGEALHILVIDEQLQDMDLLAFLQGLEALSLRTRPMVFALCAQRRFGEAGELLAHGADDCFVKPFQLAALVQRIEWLYEKKNGAITQVCERLYRDWGILQEESGTVYLTQAVTMMAQSPEKLAIRKEILASVGQTHGCSALAVDSAIRRLIKRAETGAAPAYAQFKRDMGLSGALNTKQLLYAMKEYAQTQQEQHATGQGNEALV